MYQGHLSDGSSIQKHSAGSYYPLIVSVVEHTEYRSTSCPDGIGFAEVMNSAGDIVFSRGYPLLDQQARLAAYEEAYEQAENFAALMRGAACTA